MDQQLPTQAIVQAAQASPESVLHWALGVIMTGISVVGAAVVRMVLRHEHEIKVTGALQAERHTENKEALEDLREGQRAALRTLDAIRQEQQDVLLALRVEQHRQRGGH